MKITIELDLPEGQAIPTPEDIIRLTNPDWIASWWHIDDVRSIDEYHEPEDHWDLTDSECRQVLLLANKNHDSEVGINYDVLNYWIDHVKEQRKEAA